MKTISSINYSCMHCSLDIIRLVTSHIVNHFKVFNKTVIATNTIYLEVILFLNNKLTIFFINLGNNGYY